MIDKQQWVFIIIFSLLVGVVGAAYELQFWMMMLVVFVVVSLTTYVPLLWVLYVTTNMDRVERFLQRKKDKQPLFAFYYALANDLGHESKTALTALLKKYKNPSYQAVYEVTYALYFGRIQEKREVIPTIIQPNLRNYYEAVLATEDGDLEKAEQIANTIPKEWMKQELLGLVATKRGNHEAAVVHRKQAISATRGLQRYILTKRY